MRRRWLSRGITTMLLIATALTAGSGAAQAAPAAHRYRPVSLGTLGGPSTSPQALNDRGEVVGTSMVDQRTWHGFLWRGGRMVDLGAIEPQEINNRGEILAIKSSDRTSHLFRWSAGHLVDLGKIKAPADSFTVALNNRGEVLGYGYRGAAHTRYVYLWSHGRLRVLNGLDTGADLNDQGQVAGGHPLGTDGYHAVRWQQGHLTDLGAASFDQANAYAINARGWIIGWTLSAAHDVHGALWRGTTRTDVGTLGGDYTQLAALNDAGQIVGTSSKAGPGWWPVLWEHGRLVDLTRRGVDSSAQPVDINNHGWILAVRVGPPTSGAVLYR